MSYPKINQVKVHNILALAHPERLLPLFWTNKTELRTNGYILTTRPDSHQFFSNRQKAELSKEAWLRAVKANPSLNTF